MGQVAGGAEEYECVGMISAHELLVVGQQVACAQSCYGLGMPLGYRNSVNAATGKG